MVRPALVRGAVVISDRYVDSSLAYQGAGRTLPAQEVSWLSSWATGGLKPDLVVLLDVDPRTGLARVESRRQGADRLEAESIAFHERVRYAFLDLAAADPKRYLVLDASRSAEEIAEAVARRVDEFLVDPAGIVHPRRPTARTPPSSPSYPTRSSWPWSAPPDGGRLRRPGRAGRGGGDPAPRRRLGRRAAECPHRAPGPCWRGTGPDGGPSRRRSDGRPRVGMTHAWIFTGPPGSGRSVAARAFTAALQCVHGTGCGACPGCRTTLAGTHADVRLVVPEGLSIGVDEMRALVLRAA
ncbi:dTMP kinase, partial [Micromonospora viridifaciens]